MTEVKLARGVLTLRPLRFAWEVGWMAIAVYHFGWWVLVPMLALAFDVEFK